MPYNIDAEQILELNTNSNSIGETQGEKTHQVRFIAVSKSGALPIVNVTFCRWP